MAPEEHSEENPERKASEEASEAASVHLDGRDSFDLSAIESAATRINLSLPNAPDEKTLQEEVFLKKEQRLELQRKSTELDGLRLDLTQRKEYANKIFSLIVWWLLAVLVVVMLQGIGNAAGWFVLSDSVLSMFIGGTTINVLGIFVIVAKYIFRVTPGEG